MGISGDAVRTIGSGVTIVVAFIGAIWYFATLEGRVRQLETQVHTLTVAPIIAGSAVGTSALVQSNSSPKPPSPTESKPLENPIAQACVELAREAVRYAAIPDINAKLEAESMMRTLGCGPPK